MENEQETLSYEQAYSELRQIIDRLENSDVNIDVLTKEIERAESLLDFCNKRLSQVEVDVQELTKRLEAFDEQNGELLE
ncbi:MAG: exodeoxyribonuclease VII small subunit [Candidatus Onthomorpha sp.]|nr:exodeoxyribonuclease VII small subunit [Bacteroidales bacterium]MCI7701284.1 exodeoxyribonuclease VII small subunit [Bacteroidales bacterium]MDD7590964.1 exodeoxyribonuclease VII small subunit [Bacteroidales bacterium]MDY5800247.1 exodeoxyribonuclease VII small subunit [Candidatus Onthomorpha sp.]MDY5826058.1 exodeoxyribonuclease VII small subunit [Candidatus Onthomorpha sp.]